MGQETASAQAVERGHQVTLAEVPDDEDVTSFMMNKKANLTPPLETAVTSPTVVQPSRVNATVMSLDFRGNGNTQNSDRA